VGDFAIEEEQYKDEKSRVGFDICNFVVIFELM